MHITVPVEGYSFTKGIPVASMGGVQDNSSRGNITIAELYIRKDNNIYILHVVYRTYYLSAKTVYIFIGNGEGILFYV